MKYPSTELLSYLTWGGNMQFILMVAGGVVLAPVVGVILIFGAGAVGVGLVRLFYKVA